jgi:hypothetical protein
VTFRVALRALATRPVRSLVLACGFGLGIAAMAGLLGVGEVILQQARSPALRGGGDLVVAGAAGELGSARFVLAHVLRGPALAARVAAASPAIETQLYLVGDGAPLPIRVRAGIPGLERALGDPETASVAAWTDSAADRAWAEPDPGDILRAMDRFHAIPEAPARERSWAEWLYFNGHREDTRFYLTFLVGPRTGPDRRGAGVRLQLDHAGRMRTFSGRAEVSETAVLAAAPDLVIGESEVRLEGLRYRARLALSEEGTARASRARTRGGSASSRAPDLTGEIVLEARPGRSLPPFEVAGARGWVTGYAVPVLSGRLDGALSLDGDVILLDGGKGYHDHNWGFWEGVSWQWGQVASDALSIVYGRIRPPADAADWTRIPGALVALGPDGPLGFATDVGIEEIGDPAAGQPREVRVRARGDALDLALDLVVADVVRTRMQGAFAEAEGTPLEFLQMRGSWRVAGSVAGRAVELAQPGSAETFRGR